MCSEPSSRRSCCPQSGTSPEWWRSGSSSPRLSPSRPSTSRSWRTTWTLWTRRSWSPAAQTPGQFRRPTSTSARGRSSATHLPETTDPTGNRTRWVATEERGKGREKDNDRDIVKAFKIKRRNYWEFLKDFMVPWLRTNKS